MRRRWIALAAAAEIALLSLYYAKSGVWVLISTWLTSFTWQPVSGPFEWLPFLGVALTSLCSILAFFTWMTLAAMLGAAILRRLDWSEKKPEKKLLLAIGLGLGALSILGFLLAWTGHLTRTSVLWMGSGLLAWCARDSWSPHAPIMPGKPDFWSRIPRHSPFFAAAVLCGVALTFHFLGALLPPAAFDEMNYQLALPKLYVLNGGFVPTPFNHLSFLPRNMCMLFALGLLSGGPVTAKLFSWAAGLLAAAALYVFGRTYVRERAAGWAVVVFLLTPVIGNQLRVAAADLGTGFYELLGVFLLLRWREDRSAKALALSSILWGLALGSKYTAIPGFLSGLLLLSWTRLRERAALRRIVADAAAYLGPAMLLWSPWLVKNWMDSGNPINPIFSTRIPSSNFFFAGRYRPLVDYAVGLGIPNYFPLHGLRDFLLLPWHVLVGHNDFNHDMGAVWLLCVPLLWLARRLHPPTSASRAEKAGVAGLLAFSVLYWMFWLGSDVRMTRYFVAGLGLSSLASGWILDRAEQTLPASAGLRWALYAPILFAMAQQTGRMVYIQNQYKKPWGYLAGRCSLGDYLDDVLADSPYDAYDFINRKVPPNATVLVINEFRTFYLDRNFLASTPWDHDYWHQWVKESRDPDDILQFLRRSGISYIVENGAYLNGRTGFSPPDPWTPEEIKRAWKFMKNNAKIIFMSNSGVWVAQIKGNS